MISRTKSIGPAPEFSNIMAMFEKYSNKHNCESELKDIFMKHEIKIDILHFIGSLLKDVHEISDFTTGLAKKLFERYKTEIIRLGI